MTEAKLKIWGWTLSLDLKNCNPNVRDSKVIEEFGHELVEAIDMTEYGSPNIVHFGKDDKAGWTWSQLLTTSNCCAHFCDSGDGYIDIFTCKEFKPSVAIEVIEKYFAPEHMSIHFRERGVPL
jgi:S-adenosylmethionine/arginine decarboxylase-like enzyme